MSLTIEKAFESVIDNIFNRWTALKLSVEHGLGGKNGHQTAISIAEYIKEYCLKNDNVIVSEIEEVLEDLMDQEFDTICEDGSIREISELLVKYLNMCKLGQFNEIESEFSKMSPMNKWLVANAKVQYVEESSSESDNDMEEDPIPTSKSENVDDEWTVVTTRKKRK